MIKTSTHLLLAVSILGLSYVTALAWWSPAQVMALVNVSLPNTDALSSIRGIYGGVGTCVLLVMAYLWKNNLPLAIRLLAAFWLLYALARTITWWVDGPLGDFGKLWLIIEASLGSLALVLAKFQSLR